MARFSSFLSFRCRGCPERKPKGRKSIFLSLRGRQDEAISITNRKSQTCGERSRTIENLCPRKRLSKNHYIIGVQSSVNPVPYILHALRCIKNQRFLRKITEPKRSNICRVCRFLHTYLRTFSGMDNIPYMVFTFTVPNYLVPFR